MKVAAAIESQGKKRFLNMDTFGRIELEHSRKIVRFGPRGSGESRDRPFEVGVSATLPAGPGLQNLFIPVQEPLGRQQALARGSKPEGNFLEVLAVGRWGTKDDVSY